MLIYGANGYTGRLIAEEATRRGLRPTLAGRNRQAIESLAGELGCPAAVFALDDAKEVARQLRAWRESAVAVSSPGNGSAERPVVLNCAGPFEKTAPIFMPACVEAGASYLDITGEITVIEQAAAMDAAARDAGVLLMPAVGFDVVPSDCFAAALARRCPGATHLQLAFAPGGELGGGISRGTARTAWENASRGGMVREGGQLKSVPPAWKVERIAYPRGIRHAMTIPWGDVASAYYSTGIPNIEVFLAMPRRTIHRLRRWRGLSKLVGVWPISAIGRWYIDRTFKGPTAEQRASGYAEFWGRAWKDEAQTEEGQLMGCGSVEGTMITPEPYALTVQTALDAAQRVAGGSGQPGFRTPSQVLDEDYLRSLVGEGNLKFTE